MIEILKGVVIGSVDAGDYDKRITIYTQELGKLKAKVTGVKKSASKLRGLTLNFSECRFQIYLHGTRRSVPHDPGKITGGEILDSHPTLRTVWDRMVQAATFCETLDKLTHSSYPNAKEYELLTSSLAQIEKSSMPILVRLRSTLILLKILGYSLRHHSTWTTYSEIQRLLLTRLAKWEPEQDGFCREDADQLERMVSSYLSRYLSYPLKTALFQQKFNAGSLPQSSISLS